MNPLSIISLVATVVLFGAAIFLGVQNRADSVKMRGRIVALEEQMNAGGGSGQAPDQPSIEQQLLAQQNAELEAVKEELAMKAQEQQELDQQFQKIQDDKNRPLTQAQRKIASAPAIAEVVEYVPDLGFASLNAGTNRQLEPGMEFAVRREQYLIGRIVIGQTVDAETCIADVIPGTVPEGFTIEAGDEVVQLMR